MKHFNLIMNGKNLRVSSANFRTSKGAFAIFPDHVSLVGKGNLLYYHINGQKVICEQPCVFSFSDNELNIHNLL